MITATANNMLDLSIVAPAHNEQDNVRPLVEEIVRFIEPLGLEYEIIIVDDGSTDNTAAALRELLVEQPRLRVIRMLETPAGRGNGQSAAFHAGFHSSRGELIAVLDADLQNDPADLPRMLDLMKRTGAHMVQGDRSRVRADGSWRKFSSWVGRVFRKGILGDSVRDTGCSLRLMKREVALRIPLEFRGMHRFIPISARHMGYTVVEIPVNHRLRASGTPKYGTIDRAIVGIADCFAVRWMSRRRRPVRCECVELPVESVIEVSAVPEPRPQSRERVAS
jgi:glycosyltransferase involved in cell wall biosynthesis